jgi:DNA-binding GntR family transcriptional regulator
MAGSQTSGAQVAADTDLSRALRFLREAVLRGDYGPGQKLHQGELSERLDMSPTPIREALRVLEAQGFVEHVPYKGVYVKEVSPEESQEISVIRSALEGLATQLAVPHLTAEDVATLESLTGQMEEAWQRLNLKRVRRSNYQFHSLIYGKAGSQRLKDMIEGLWPNFATDLLWMIPGRADRSIQQHHALVGAIRDGDAEVAAELMSDHILTAGQSITRFLKGQQAE